MCHTAELEATKERALELEDAVDKNNMAIKRAQQENLKNIHVLEKEVLSYVASACSNARERSDKQSYAVGQAWSFKSNVDNMGKKPFLL